MAHGWEGELVRLVPLDYDRHFENVVRWVNDPEVTQWVIVGDFPLTKFAEQEWFERAAKASETEIVFAIETLGGKHIGSSGVHHVSFRHSNCTTGSLIGEKDEWGKGYGTDAARVRARYCFEVLGLQTLYTAFLDGNDRSRRMSEKNGYRECGRFPKRYWKRGAFRDEISMVLERETWLGLQR
ncbi:MAG: GNAT family N-acetyltransferase [Armatimonadetes bacterium]|nr:GNAT family N-acetyltransferase [Armatimonadota bacterium]